MSFIFQKLQKAFGPIQNFQHHSYVYLNLVYFLNNFPKFRYHLHIYRTQRISKTDIAVFLYLLFPR